MKLRDYLQANDISLAAFASDCGKAPSLVHDWCSGRRVPRAVSLAMIERLTEGRVRVSDFVEGVQGK